MDSLYGRTVFFVNDAERSLSFYTEALGFSLDWNHQENGRACVFQVSLLGFQLILNQIEDWTRARAGHGRVFIGLEDNQVEALRQHIKEKGIKAGSRKIQGQKATRRSASRDHTDRQGPAGNTRPLA